jgi:hypothetical protein
MRTNYLKTILNGAVALACIFLLGAVATFGQTTVSLTAGASTITTPDGNLVTMWGYTCGTVTASCAPLNTSSMGWAPVVITVPTGNDLIINLTNNLTVPTSLVIVGQLGGGLGGVTSSCGGSSATGETCTPAPDHSNAQYQTWPSVDTTNLGTAVPVQGPRVRSFGTEVPATGTAALCWGVCGLGAGHPALKPGTYLLESGSHPSIQGPMGLYGIVVVTTAPVGTTAGTAYGTAGTASAVSYNAEIPLLLSEIDPVQNNSVATAVATTGFDETMVWSGLPGGCGDPASATYNQCYPPAVNYTPLYYLINGVPFSRSNATASQFSAAPAGVAGTVLVRLVNAGLRMHVPSIVGAQTGTTGAAGFSLIAEDGNPLPGTPRVQSEVFMAAGKTYDVMVNVPTSTTAPALPIFDRELSLSGNATARDAGMLAYISINTSTEQSGIVGAVAAADDTYPSVVACTAAPCVQVVVADPIHGVIANDINVYGVTLLAAPAGGTVNLNRDGTFTYTPNVGTSTDTFTYCANGSVTGTTCSSGFTATVHLNAASVEAATGITMVGITFTSNVATTLSIKPPGILAVDKDAAGYALTVNGATAAAPLAVAMSPSGTATVDQNGGFTATVSAAGTYTFTYKAQNAQGTVSSSTATVTVIFPTPTNLQVSVVDGPTGAAINDYRWIIEEDRTFFVDPGCTTNPPPATSPVTNQPCPSPTGIVPTFGTNFHTSYMPVVADGCVGTIACEDGQTLLGQNAVCDIGNGVCRTGASQQTELNPNRVALDPTKRYYISVLPGDAANSFENASTCLHDCGHGMGGAPILFPPTNAAVKVLVQRNPFPPAKLSVFVFEDDFPLNGEHDGGGGVDVLSPNEPGLGNFNIILFDDAGGSGDATGQMTYDMFNQPLSNALAGYKDPATGLDACPVSKSALVGIDTNTGNFNAASPTGITGTIVTCPKYEADGKTLSPLAGQAVVANLMPGRYGVVATAGADRIARGEQWLQTNTLDGQKAHDSFLRIGEPSFFQEYGPAGYHVSIGFANPAIINGRKADLCAGTDPNSPAFPAPYNCAGTVTGRVTTERMSRTPDERLFSSGSIDSFAFTQCYVSLGDPDGEDFAFTKCFPDGTFSFAGIPNGDWRITVFDQWNDMLVDGLSTPVRVPSGGTASLGEIAMNQWQANIYTTTFFDANGNGVRDPGESGLALVATNNRFRDGSFSNFNNTDLDGNAGFNEIFPLFSWYVIETDSTRYKNTGTHVVYDAGGPADGACPSASTTLCGGSTIAANFANTAEMVSVPTTPQNLRVPGAVYCASADCTGKSIASGPGSSDPPSACTISSTTGNISCSDQLSTGRIDPAWVTSEGWQGFSGQNNFIEFGKRPFAVGENGGIRGHVIYASTRPFDDPQLLLQTSWAPLVPGVTINLYQEGTDAGGAPTLKLIDTTTTSSWDAWAQGFRSDGVPNMNCPGQLAAPTTSLGGDLFFFSLYNQPQWLNFYNSQHGGTAVTALPVNSQFKCYDGMHNWNQVQPAPYDGKYQFPSVTGINPTTGRPTGTNCTGCMTNPDTTDPYRSGLPMLPAGKYVVEMIVPPNYELVKEEDKNILIGDNYIAPVTQQFGGLGNVFILPDMAEIAALYNANNPQNPTQTLNATPRHEGDTGSVESFWPCVGASRIVPDFISLFPQSGEVSPFAGATRNLCDRKEVILEDQSSVLAKFYVFTSTHVAAHFTGVITDDFTSEFDPFSPQFGEKFSPPDLPVSLKDWSGTEIARVYADHWGAYNGLTYSTWEVNPPNPTGYAPTMMVTCMNDPGNGAAPDPLFNPQYSQFCYEIPFMPGQTQYMDTPVTPTSAFAGAGYNNPDCNYPDGTPAIKEVDSQDGIGPWVSLAGHSLTITSLGTITVPNNGYSGPAANTTPFNLKTVTRDYSFGTTQGGVTIGGHTATVTGWSPSSITVTVPTGVSNCTIQQQIQFSGLAATATAQCGQLIITRGDNHKQSVDSVTVTIGGKTPTHVAASASVQAAIDAAKPGDMLMIDPTCTSAGAVVACTTAGATKSPAAHNEILIMWKPVRLQGVGAASSVINANTHPAGKLDVWRRQVDCLFGLALNGGPVVPSSGPVNPFDPTGTYTCPGSGWFGYQATAINPQVDRLPLEATVGWDANLNGNLAELLQEPSLMGALEGAGITVLSKGVVFPSNPFDPTLLAGFPTGTLLLNNSTNVTRGCGTNTATARNPFPSSFWCNPSSIDGLGITDSSQGGGGIFVHGWGHNIQIANNRIFNNVGTLSGGVNVGQGEFPGAYLGGAGAANAAPGSCQSSIITNLQLPFCFDMNVNVNHNYITQNASLGDELFSATPAGAGGVSFCTGSDYYLFQYNWVCGNLSTGDGGGLGHLGFIYHGDIEHNTIIFNQSANPTIATNGGGLLVMGSPDVDPTCGATTDLDCMPPIGSVGPSDGTGPGLVINANLIMGNAAESGSGGGLRLQQINGTDVVNFPAGLLECLTIPLCAWNSVTVTNNIIANNVAGWDGGGVSMQDALVVNFINNTVISNDATGSSGVLFDTLGAPLASSGGTNCIQSGSTTSSCPQPAGLVVVPNSPNFVANLPATGFSCPLSHGAVGTQCRNYSVPILYNDLFWKNRSFYIGVGGLGMGTLNQQNVVALYNAFTTTQVTSEPTTDATTSNGGGAIVTGGSGACVSGVAYWDLGVRGDTGPTNHTGSGGTVLLSPEASFITSTAGGYGGGGLGVRVNSAVDPTVVSQYCNGSRTPPEFKSSGYQVPPGIADATVPNPLFNLSPSATVDEGNNWININWGPLALNNTTVLGTDGNYGGGSPLGNYALAAGSTAINYITPANSALTYIAAPPADFFGTPRPQGAGIEVGAVEFVSTTPAPTLSSISPTSGARGTAVNVTLTGTNLTGTSAVNVSCAIALFCTNGITVSNVTVVSATSVTATFTIASNASIALLANRNVSVTTPGGTSNTVTFTVVNPPPATLSSIAPNSSTVAQRGTNVNVTLTGTNFTAGSTVAVGGTGNGGAGVSVVAGSVVVVDSTHITATFAITAGGTNLGAKNVRVTNASGTASNNVTFTKN